MIPDRFQPAPTHVQAAQRARGVDLSSYQSIDFTHSVIDRDEVDFAIVKTTQGLDYVNPLALTQIGALQAHGVPYGLYHFLVDEDGAKQWNHFEAASPAIGRLGVLVACDYEAGGLPVNAHGDAVCRAFLKRGRQRGYRVGLYGSADVARRNLGQAWTWAAWWDATPPPFRWDFWQFANGPGCDWNVFRDTPTALRAFCAKYGGKPVASPPPSRWWLHDETTKHALGPYRSAAVAAARLAAYAVTHPNSSSLLVERS